MIIRRLLVGLLTGAAAGALAGAALADPSARVGRVADTEGDVSMQAPGSTVWIWATRNYPVAPSESFWTGDDGRTRLEIGSVDARVDSDTELDVLDLDYGGMRLGLPQGSLEVRLWESPRGGVIIATPAGDVRLNGHGLYRIDVGAPQPDGSYPPVELTVFEGQAFAPSPEGPVPFYPGQAALIYAGYDPQPQTGQSASIDDWGRVLEARQTWRPTDLGDAALTGLADLSGAGDYGQDPQYGRVWFPRDVPPDWAPYRYGHWSYVQPWGYTWIDDQPWGFAPFHYGRWARIDGRWGWIPGQKAAEPVYAPALVAFIGGVGWNLGGSDAIGWTPLAPDEVYRPRYEVSNDYLRRVNVTNVRATTITNITNVTTVINYRNAPATTVVRTAAFTGAQPVHRSVIPVTAEVIARAPPAIAANRPPPPPAARPGSERFAEGGGAGMRAAPTLTNRPPAVLQATRAAVIAPLAQGAAGRPPAIVGARVGPPPARPMGAAAPVMISPSQLHHAAPPTSALSSATVPAARAPMPPSRPDAANAAAARDAQAARASAAQAEAQQAREAAQARAAEAQAQAQARAAQVQAAAARDAQQAAQARAQAQAQAQAQAMAREAEARRTEVRPAPAKAPAEKPTPKAEPRPREEGPGRPQP